MLNDTVRLGTVEENRQETGHLVSKKLNEHTGGWPPYHGSPQPSTFTWTDPTGLLSCSPREQKWELNHGTRETPGWSWETNIARLPNIAEVRVQTDCYPGAKIAHAIHILRHKTGIAPMVTAAILWFWTHDREASNPSFLHKSPGALFSTAKQTFPNVVLYMPIINFSENLLPQIQRNITQLKEMIKFWSSFIPQLDRRSHWR